MDSTGHKFLCQLMNFVNSLMAKDLVMPAFHQVEDNRVAFPFTDMPIEACRAAIASGFHNVHTMGSTQAHVEASIKSWMASVFVFFPLYLQSLYEVFTLDEVNHHGKMISRGDMNKTMARVLRHCSDHYRIIIVRARRYIIHHHDKATQWELDDNDPADFSYVLTEGFYSESESESESDEEDE